MISDLRANLQTGRLWIWGMVMGVLLAAAWFGSHVSLLWLALPLAGVGAFVLLQAPRTGLLALIAVALVGRLQIGTGTEVALNPATLLVPTLLGIWILDMMRGGEVRLAPSLINRPLLLFLAAGLLSLLIGIVTWDLAVPRSGQFTIVQLAQWAIFAFSAGAFLLTGNLIQDLTWLRRLVFFFLALAGALAILRVVPPTAAVLVRYATVDRAPFWLLLTALSGGQLAFNSKLPVRWRLFLGASLGACLVYAFYEQRATASNWVGVAAVLGVLAWLRWPRLRWPVIILLVVLAVSGGLFSTVYEFAGGGNEWEESGGSRLALIGRVVEVTMRNPITGLGPAAYRQYGFTGSLAYGQAFYVSVALSSHNNYVDLFSHVGLIGLGLFAWFAVELARLGFRLRTRFTGGFPAGYANGMLAAGAGALVLMLLADWILPFVYNIGFEGFQSAVLVWLFLGGLVALEYIADREAAG